MSEGGKFDKYKKCWWQTGEYEGGGKTKIWGRFWCNDKFIVVNGSCGLICKVIANYFIYTFGYVVVSLRLCLVVSFCPMFRIVVSPCVNFLFAICVACDVWWQELQFETRNCRRSVVGACQWFKHPQHKKTEQSQIRRHLFSCDRRAFVQNVLHWHGSQIAHVAIFSWRKHP